MVATSVVDRVMVALEMASQSVPEARQGWATPGAAPERIATEREVGKLLEERRRQRRLASITGEAIPGTQQQTMTEYVFGSMPI